MRRTYMYYLYTYICTENRAYTLSFLHLITPPNESVDKTKRNSTSTTTATAITITIVEEIAVTPPSSLLEQ